MLGETLSLLAKEYPSAVDTVASIVALDAEVDRLQLEPFVEPVSATIRSDGKQRLLQVEPDDLGSWTRHVALGTYCRLRALEEPTAGSLARGQVLAAMTLLRSHLEGAALAAYCLDELTGAARNGNMDLVGELIPKTLFGTAMQKHQHKPSIADLLTFFEGETIRICRAVDALDRYYYGEVADGQLAVAYSLLCEFAHPNHRGVMHFMSAEERGDGWLVSYRANERPDEASVAKALDILLVSMRAGYSAGEMLRCWRFGRHDGVVTGSGPNDKDASWIWRRLLQRPIDA